MSDFDFGRDDRRRDDERDAARDDATRPDDDLEAALFGDSGQEYDDEVADTELVDDEFDHDADDSPFHDESPRHGALFDEELETEAPPVDRVRRPGGVLAFAALTALGLAALTGVGLEFHYTPSAGLAHASLLALEQDEPYGGLLRTLHFVAAHAAIALLVVALLAAFVGGQWRRGGTLAWWTGLLVFLTTVAVGVTGELLPWTEQGVFATEVRTGILGMTPEVGGELRRAALGGEVVAGPTLTRFHALHVIALPLVLGLLLFLHVRARRRLHADPAAGVTLGQACAGLLTAAAIGWGATRLSAPLGGMYVAGDAGFEPWPEWHFLWLNALIHYLPEYERVVAVWLPGGLLLAALLLPVLDRQRRRRTAHPLVLVPGLLVLGGIVAVSVVHAGERPENDPALPYSLDFTAQERLGYRSVRRHDCLECHTYALDGVTYGEEQHDAPPFNEFSTELTVRDYAEGLADPEGVLFTDEEMPAYHYVPEEHRRAVGAYLRRIAGG